MTTFLQLVVVGLSTGSAFALVGIGLVLVYRTTGIVNFAQGVFAVIGGLVTFQLADGLPLVVATLVAVLVAAVLSLVLAVVAVGFRGRTTNLASIIITLGGPICRGAVPRFSPRRSCGWSSATFRARIAGSRITPGTSTAFSSSRSTC